jgi:hypothetical protein
MDNSLLVAAIKSSLSVDMTGATESSYKPPGQSILVFLELPSSNVQSNFGALRSSFEAGTAAS